MVVCARGARAPAGGRCGGAGRGRRAGGVARRRRGARFHSFLTEAAPPPRASRPAPRRFIAKQAAQCDPVVVEVMPAEEDPAAMECREPVDSPQQFCLRWNNYQSNLTSSFDQLLQTQSFVDVTLSCDGQSLKAHKVVLSACSPYFQSLFMDNPCQHPIIIMRDTKYCDLKAAVDFMYRGEINVSQEQIPALLKVAESLKIRGLTDVSGDHAVVQPGTRSTKRPDRSREADSPPKARRRMSEDRASGGSSRAPPPTPSPTPAADLLPPAEPASAAPVLPPLHPDDVDIRPGIAEMIREEERVSPGRAAPRCS
uniref:BTB domain-containing protein n=2 Tax=Heliothis virescens TaxID=7102 RepID=A0A2A4IWZ7_HELVI